MPGRSAGVRGYVDDGIDALMNIIENKDGVADKRIYNIGNPKNSHSVKELADMMMEIALSMPEYQTAPRRSSSWK